MRRSAVLSALVGVLLPCTAIGTEVEAKLTAAELAAKIDAYLAAKWKERKATPAPRADDAEWVRRLHLDLTGRIPDILAARDFAENPAKDKRAKLIDTLLASDRYPLHFANVWRSWFMPDSNDQQVMFLIPGFENWLRGQFKSNAGYHTMAASVITGKTSTATGADAFYQANLFKPEALASAVSRLFLGVKLECAQCHNHPFAKWQRKQFWEFAAFFTGINNRFARFGGLGGQPPAVAGGTGEIKIPGTDKTVKARFLDGKLPKWKGDTRSTLADWIATPDNALFARAAVNRYWEYLTGTGLVEPLDEESADNPPSHPELMTLLAKQFAAHDFDLKYLIRAITLSRAYQLSSKHTHASQADARLFARMKVRGLSPEQLFDSLALATGQKDPEPDYTTNPFFGRVNPGTPRADFLRRFPNQDKRTEQQVSILQALYLMNGKIVADATSLEHNKNLAIIAQATTVRTSRRIEQLFLITLARKPTPAESVRLVKYVDKGGPTADPALALCDVFWALLNSSEFCVNH
jgi:hypothetical protein